jgi:hypothetical protein
MRSVCLIALLLAVMCCATAASAAEPPALAKARTLYNAADYEGAIDAAAVARLQPQWADAAALVIARAYLERYRQRADPADLSAAREALSTVHSAMLTPRDQVDLLIGLGQALFLGEIYGAAAELFDTALSRSPLISGADRLMLLDWWASALDREAQARPADVRTRMFDRLTARMEEELRLDPGSPVANYWLAVAARGAGDLDRAWAAAVAAWVRSGLNRGSTEQLRMDLDRLVTQALIPERARTRPAREQQEAISELRADWDLVKQQWQWK